MAAEEECAEEADEVDEVAQRAAPICGVDWQDAYAAFHADVVAGPSSSARLLVFDASGNGGLADRLTGLMTALLLAILSDRAIALDWSGREVALRMALEWCGRSGGEKGVHSNERLHIGKE